MYFGRELSDDLWNLIVACWAQDPAQRCSIKEILAALCSMTKPTQDRRILPIRILYIIGMSILVVLGILKFLGCMSLMDFCFLLRVILRIGYLILTAQCLAQSLARCCLEVRISTYSNLTLIAFHRTLEAMYRLHFATNDTQVWR